MTPEGPGGDSGHSGGPSVPCLLYLFADQVVPHSTILSHLDAQHGVRLPCGRPSVQLGPFERLVFAWTLWQLREGGLIELGYLEALDDDQAAEANGGDEPLSEIVVRRLGDASGAEGLEAEVLRACGTDEEPIGPILRRWAGQHIPLPLYAVVRGLQMEAASYGLVELQQRGGPLDPFTDHRLTPFATEDCERIGTVEPRFAGLLARWREFEAQRPRAAADLEEQCRLALFDLRPPPILAIGGPTPN